MAVKVNKLTVMQFIQLDLEYLPNLMLEDSEQLKFSTGFDKFNIYLHTFRGINVMARKHK